MEFIGGVQTIFFAYFPEFIIGVICGVLFLPVHDNLYRTLDVVAVFSSFILYKSLDWHNHIAESGYLRFAEGFKNIVDEAAHHFLAVSQ